MHYGRSFARVRHFLFENAGHRFEVRKSSILPSIRCFLHIYHNQGFMYSMVQSACHYEFYPRESQKVIHLRHGTVVNFEHPSCQLLAPAVGDQIFNCSWRWPVFILNQSIDATWLGLDQSQILAPHFLVDFCCLWLCFVKDPWCTHVHIFTSDFKSMVALLRILTYWVHSGSVEKGKNLEWNKECLTVQSTWERSKGTYKISLREIIQCTHPNSPPTELKKKTMNAYQRKFTQMHGIDLFRELPFWRLHD